MVNIQSRIRVRDQVRVHVRVSVRVIWIRFGFGVLSSGKGLSLGEG